MEILRLVLPHRYTCIGKIPWIIPAMRTFTPFQLVCEMHKQLCHCDNRSEFEMHHFEFEKQNMKTDYSRSLVTLRSLLMVFNCSWRRANAMNHPQLQILVIISLCEIEAINFTSDAVFSMHYNPRRWCKIHDDARQFASKDLSKPIRGWRNR